LLAGPHSRAALKAFDQSIATELAALEESQLQDAEAEAQEKAATLAHEQEQHLTRVADLKALAARQRERAAHKDTLERREIKSEEGEEEEEEDLLNDWRRRRV